MNHLKHLGSLRNRYFIMRHGQSKANLLKVIVSCPENDRNGDYGLSALGREQALKSAIASGLPADTVIFSSDFSRARETAKIVREFLGAPEVIVTAALRERRFGDWEGTDTANYREVWAADETNGGHREHDVEPASAVLDRVTAFVAGLERHYAGRDILLVSHGDTLQILQAGFQGIEPAAHRSIAHLETAEIRHVPCQADLRP
jgi:broad specificity phosphatase PhoE